MTQTQPPGETSVPAKQYPDLHDHVARLEEEGLLVRVSRPINKDTELHPLVRWQYLGLDEDEDRRAFLFDNVVDSKGRSYDIPVVVGVFSANSRVYEIAMGIDDPEKRQGVWKKAVEEQHAPVLIPSEHAPIHEVIYTGDELNSFEKGVGHLPVPISTPGWDNAPYVSSSNFITKDPETGVHNIGTYRAMIKSNTRIGMNPSVEMNQGIYDHFLKYRERSEPMPAVLCIGGPPCIPFVAKQKLDMQLDEYHVAGGLVGAPLRVVEARTVPVLVPADAEICIEGYINTEYLEPEGPFGESHGYMNPKEYNAFMDVTAITRREKPYLMSILSQIAPSEASVQRKLSSSWLFLNHLTRIGITCVSRVQLHETSGMTRYCIMQCKPNAADSEVWRAMYACLTLNGGWPKIVIAVDEDIDPQDADAVWWAMGIRSTPHKDIEIVKRREPGHGPRGEDEDERGIASESGVLWDARAKHKMPPTSLPKREHMENARKIWEELGLPKLHEHSRWFGYNLGEWNEELDEEAALAEQSDYFVTGDKIAEQRVKFGEVSMNSKYYKD